MSNLKKILICALSVIVLVGVSFYAGVRHADSKRYEYAVTVFALQAVGETAISVLKSRRSFSDSTLASWESCLRNPGCVEPDELIDLIRVPTDSLGARIIAVREASEL